MLLVGIVITYPGDPRKCCGKQVDYTRYAMLTFNEDTEIIDHTKLFDSYLNLMQKYGKWQTLWHTLDKEVQERCLQSIQSWYGSFSYLS